MNIKIRNSDLEILEIYSEHTVAEILNHLAAVSQELSQRYNSRIPWDNSYFNTGRDSDNTCRFYRTYKVPDRKKGIKLCYRFLYRDITKTNLLVLVSARRSTWGSATEIDTKEIYSNFATETINNMLMD